MIRLIRRCLLFRVIFHLLVARINFALLRRCIRAAFVMRIRVIRDLVPATRANVVTVVSGVRCRFVDGATTIQKVGRGGRWRRRQRGRRRRRRRRRQRTRDFVSLSRCRGRCLIVLVGVIRALFRTVRIGHSYCRAAAVIRVATVASGWCHWYVRFRLRVMLLMSRRGRKMRRRFVQIGYVRNGYMRMMKLLRRVWNRM